MFEEGESHLPVVGHADKYEVTSRGRVYSHLTGRFLKPIPARGGRLYVNLGRNCRRYIHHLVLEAFVATRPPTPGNNGLHKNDIVTDNRPENLYWGTYSENMSDRIANGRHPNVEKAVCKRGHDFTPENTINRKDGGRGCRACNRDYQREWNRRCRKSRNTVAA